MTFSGGWGGWGGSSINWCLGEVGTAQQLHLEPSGRGKSLSRRTRRNECAPLLVARIPKRRRRQFDSRILVFFSLRSRRTNEPTHSKTGGGQAEHDINHVLPAPFVRSAEWQKCLFCSIWSVLGGHGAQSSYVGRAQV